MISTVGIIFDVSIVLVLVLFSIIGLKKGFLKSILSLFNWSICLIIAILLAKYVATWINGIYDFSSLIGNKITKDLIKLNDFFGQSINVYESAGKTALIQASSDLKINSLLKQLIKVVFSTTKVDMTSTDTIGSIVGDSLGHICFVIISGILVFIILMIALKLLSKLFKNIEQTKIIGGLNKILGLAFGLIKAVLIVVMVNIVLVGLSLIPAVNKGLTPLIQDNTYVEKFVYNTTDKLFEKFVIEGDTVQNLVEKLWNKR